MIFMVGGEALRPYVSFIPSSVFDILANKKFAVTIGQLVAFYALNHYITVTGAFEVTVADVSIWSKLSSGIMPTAENIIEGLLDLGYKIRN